ncbi:unnamed protein product, partial [Meganyctiphanes norvegica]
MGSLSPEPGRRNTLRPRPSKSLDQTHQNDIAYKYLTTRPSKSVDNSGQDNDLSYNYRSRSVNRSRSLGSRHDSYASIHRPISRVVSASSIASLNLQENLLMLPNKKEPDLVQPLDHHTCHRIITDYMKIPEFVYKAIMTGGKLEEVEDWISRNESNIYSTNGKLRKQTPLHLACQSDREDVVDILLQHQVCLMCVDANNETPLQVAARKGHPGICERIIQAKHLRCAISLGEKRTALALLKQHYENEAHVLKKMKFECRSNDPREKLIRAVKQILHFFPIFLLFPSVSGAILLFNYKTTINFLHECPGQDAVLSEAIISYPLKLISIRPALDICHGNTVYLVLEGDFSQQCTGFVVCCVIMIVIALLYTLAVMFSVLPKSLCLPSKSRKWTENLVKNNFFSFTSIILSLLAMVVWMVITSMLTIAVQDFQNALDFHVLKEVNINICAAYTCIEGKGPDTGKLWGVV